jgi:hypothetical protein
VFRSFGLSVPENANVVSTVHNPLISGLRIGQPATKMLLLNKFFLFWFDIFVVHGRVLFNIGQSVDSKDMRLIHAVTVQSLYSSDGGFGIFEINKTVTIGKMISIDSN